MRGRNRKAIRVGKLKFIKMRKNYFLGLILVFAIGLVANQVHSQGAYVNVNLGYGMKTSCSNLEEFYNYTSSSGTSTSEQVNVSLGKGFNVGGTFGNMFNKNVGAELGINYLLGGKTEAKDTYSDGTSTSTISAKMLRFMPSLVIASGLEKVNPYARFGLVIGTGSIKNEVDGNNEDGDVYMHEWKYSGGVAFGLNAGVGAIFNLSDNMGLFAELNMINLSYAPTKGELKEATYNGIDRLPDLTTSVKEIEFVDSYTYSSSNPPSDSQPDQELKVKAPFGSFGINFGLRIGF
jgi:opacity protein-like surface antigen